MERRFKLGNAIADTQRTPSLRFSSDGRNLIMTIPVVSTDPQAEDQQRGQIDSQKATHRDIFELSTGSAYGANLKASLTSKGEAATILSVSMEVNSKVPGTGAAAEMLQHNGRDNGKS